MRMRTGLTMTTGLYLLASFALAGDFPLDEPLTTDTPATTVTGNPFTAPAEWHITVNGPATIITAPEGGSQVGYVDIEAENAEAAMNAAWDAYKEHDWPLKVVDDVADSDGWTKQRRFEYQVSPNEKRFVSAGAMFANDSWTVWIYDMANDVGGKRGAQVNLLMSSLLPRGYEKESFAGKEAHRLDDERLAELTGFIERGLEHSGVPGTSVSIIQDGEVVFSGGFGVRELGKPEKVAGDTLYMIASNSKGLSTLLLAKLVDAGEIDWKDRVVDVLPGFKLGDEETTEKVLIEHLVCACTGLPRQDMEWILDFGSYTPESAMELLGRDQQHLLRDPVSINPLYFLDSPLEEDFEPSANPAANINYSAWRHHINQQGHDLSGRRQRIGQLMRIEMFVVYHSSSLHGVYSLPVELRLCRSTNGHTHWPRSTPSSDLVRSNRCSNA